jgi:hypothetical protein
MRQLLRQVQQSMVENREMRREMNSLSDDVHVLTNSIHSLASAPMPTPLTTARTSTWLSDNQQPAAHLQRPQHITLTANHVPSRQTLILPSAAHSAAADATTPATSPSASTPANLSSSTSHAPAPLHFTSHRLAVRDTFIVYDRDLLLPPPHRDFAANPELLADDWEHLKFNLHPGQLEDIGVKYWKQLYKGTKYWARLRKYYSNWAVRIARISFHSKHARLTSFRFTVRRRCILSIHNSRELLDDIFY